MVLCWKQVDCSEELEYLRAIFRYLQETVRCFGVAAEIQMSCQIVMVKTELNHEANLSIYQSVHIHVLTSGQELWVIAK